MVLISTISTVVALLTVTVIVLGAAFYRMKKKSDNTNTGTTTIIIHASYIITDFTEIMTTTNNPAYAVIERGDTKHDDYENIVF